MASGSLATPEARANHAPHSRNGQAGEQSLDDAELRDWFESLEDVLHRHGSTEATRLLRRLDDYARKHGVELPFDPTTPYVNTISPERQPDYPGDEELERTIRSLIRWNAAAMVVRANKGDTGVGGHISTYASSCTLYEVGFNHFFHARTKDHPGDFIYFQGHAAPGMYSRAFLEGRFDESHLDNFRQELPRGTGLSSYPHPWLMPDFWQFPTVSMGLGPITSLYHARFLRYLGNRGLLQNDKSTVWAFLGDGEMDEPESLGALTLPVREGLDNVVWVVNCNLQRLDGPVRGNGKIVQELEGIFRGAGWNVVKCLWGTGWDELIAKDKTGKLVAKLEGTVDGEFQRLSTAPGAVVRKEFFGPDPDLQALVADMKDEEIERLRRGGHDPKKVYAAYQTATERNGRPTVVLAQTIKGYGLGEAGEGKMVAHNAKKMTTEQLKAFRDRFRVPVSDKECETAPFYKPDADSPEMKYLTEHREKLGGSMPRRLAEHEKLNVPGLEKFKAYFDGTGDKTVSTTFVLGQLLQRTLLKDKALGERIVPIIPDEARTFGFEGLFAQIGIYSPKGQLYEPVDRKVSMYYKESKNGQMLEEGINEAGAMSSFVAAGTAYANVGVPMIPFYVYYSMFGFQRVGDLIWLAGDSRAKGFLCGGTSGRTSLNGEGLQHQDGHSPLMASTVPNLRAYDPAYNYELAIIVQDGLRRMYAEGEDCFYYLSVYNDDSYSHPAKPEGCEEGVLRGLYKVKSVDGKNGRVQLFGSGPILPYVLRAQAILSENYGVGSDVWSVTSYSELAREARAVTRQNRLHPGETPQQSYLEQVLPTDGGPFVASSDNVRLVQDQIREWVPGRYVALGTDGFGRSETRSALRRHFEIDAECVAYAALSALAADGDFDAKKLPGVLKDLGIDPDKVDPMGA
ncbi:pyruvate dehydrogenase (acetyl-transferring), homodimeric type [Alienimonas californiensis]|uniref:Pyruvate dehydrogenase E1 component n=1 Tax=Alienimonas californiensis TaxID=2527989 RepID=A0A517P966_9PLAN|nr:pyruvate dehydrogenase (acetyl-transferring), homodimeric type [Alienimonas californiensis]QDT15923.1 Pyruvate dehydrogenase E1 component [Alienimonas californiensis]